MTRRHVLQGAAALAGASGFAAPSLAQPARTTTLRFVPQANLTALDPIWTSAIVTQMHGYHIYDTLYAVDGQQRARPHVRGLSFTTCPIFRPSAAARLP